MASENWPLDLGELNAVEHLENWRLGDLRGEIVGAHEHYGAELKKYQDAIDRHRVHRAQLRNALASRLQSTRRIDAALARDPAYQAVHHKELFFRQKARELNRLLGLLIQAREMVEEEMSTRIKARGFPPPLPGHAHLFNTNTGRYRRRKRVRARKNLLRFAARSAR